MKAIRGKVLVRIDTKQKERYALEGGPTIIIEKGYNFNLREDRASMGEVVHAYDIPTGAMVLIHHNATDKTYSVESNDILTDEEYRNGHRILSIPEDMVFCYNEGSGWIPCKNFLLTKRIFKPYKGSLVGIQPEQVKNRMYVVSGWDEWDGKKKDLSGEVVVSLVNCDYLVIWHTKENKEDMLIRTRHREIIGLDSGLKKDIQKGKYLIGNTLKDATQLMT
jgi:hypothetical protein